MQACNIKQCCDQPKLCQFGHLLFPIMLVFEQLPIIPRNYASIDCQALITAYEVTVNFDHSFGKLNISEHIIGEELAALDVLAIIFVIVRV